MFHRAVKEGPQSRAPPAKSLEKYLFPSSSPSTRNGDIVDGFNKATVKPRQAGASASAALTASPPKTRPSAHAGQPSAAQRSYSTYNPKSFESLYNKVGSFDDVEVVVPATNGKVLHDVFFSPDDFSDDENLDLEYSCPNNILPAALKEPPKTAAADGNTISQLSWSSSPASHVLPAPPPPAAQPVPVKRASPTPTGESPVAKKRRLPKNWLMSKEEEKPAPAAATPQGKAQGQLWNMTASAVKEQKRQLKEKSRKPAASETPETFQPTYQAPVLKREVFSSAITLSKEQRRIQDLVVNRGLSIFFTGPAGTGKSVLMRSIIEALRKKYAREPERLSITASTGLAACNIGGMTLHSFAGIGLGKEDTQQLVTKIRRNPKAKNRWLKTKTLIIDEISMVDGELFDKLSQIGRIIRNNGRPWGGIQLVITGDFFQLPPVPEGDKREAKFAFDAATWSTSIDHTIGLTEVFRQKDPEFAQMLNEMRLGRLSDEAVRKLQALSRPLKFGDGIEPTSLFPTRSQVDRSNEQRLNSLPGKAYQFNAIDKGDPQIRDKLLANMMAPKTITLKEGAQVMLIKNMDETLVNGSLGKVVRFMDEASFDVYQPEEEVPSFSAPESSQRVSKLRLRDFAMDPDARDGPSRDSTPYPVVRFVANDGTSRDILCNPEEWRVDSPTGEMQASRTQLPLILAWALSIHKAQGQTLDRVKVDLGKAFEKGQTYVALSRATSQEGLQVLNFSRSKVMAHPRVVNFYNNLYTANDVTLEGSMKANSAFFKPSGTGSGQAGVKGKGTTAASAHT